MPPGTAQHDASVVSRWLGADFAAGRVEHNFDVYASILAEISKLRTLDLAEQHPAIVFDLARAYHRNDAQPVADANMPRPAPMEPQ
jgi:hypothetical protein